MNDALCSHQIYFRNVLVGESLDSVKLAVRGWCCEGSLSHAQDMGMSRRIDGEYYRPSQNERVPGTSRCGICFDISGIVKWMSPEAIKDRKYTSASDVW